MARIDAVPPADWSREMRGALAAIRPEHPRHPFPEAREDRPKGLNILGTLALHPELAKAYNTFNGHILFGTTLSERQRELLVLRVAVLRNCAYEWAQHVVMAGDVGISDLEIVQLRNGPDDPAWSEGDAALVRAVDELVDHARLTDTTWATLAESFDSEQLLDLIFTVGAYETLAMVMRSLDVDLDDDLSGVDPL